MTGAETVLAWHFLREDRRLQFEPYTLVEPGQTLHISGPLMMCMCGLHASKRALDALRYAPGPIACRVQLSGDMLEKDDKLCARERTCLWVLDATKVLHEFACWCAEQALLRERAAGREPDPRSWAAIEAKRRWLRGEVSNSELCTARDAATDAAWITYWIAAGTAARDAAWAAWAAVGATAGAMVWNAALIAANAAAWAATGTATWATVGAATWAAQSAELERRLEEAHREIVAPKDGERDA